MSSMYLNGIAFSLRNKFLNRACMPLKKQVSTQIPMLQDNACVSQCFLLHVVHKC